MPTLKPREIVRVISEEDTTAQKNLDRKEFLNGLLSDILHDFGLKEVTKKDLDNCTLTTIPGNVSSYTLTYKDVILGKIVGTERAVTTGINSRLEFFPA